MTATNENAELRAKCKKIVLNPNGYNEVSVEVASALLSRLDAEKVTRENLREKIASVVYVKAAVLNLQDTYDIADAIMPLILAHAAPGAESQFHAGLDAMADERQAIRIAAMEECARWHDIQAEKCRISANTYKPGGIIASIVNATGEAHQDYAAAIRKFKGQSPSTETQS